MQIRDSSLSGQGNEQKMLFSLSTTIIISVLMPALLLCCPIGCQHPKPPQGSEATRLENGFARLTNVLQSFIGHFSLLNCRLSVPKDV